MKLISWNVNGLRAILKKDFVSQINQLQPDILCLQETKINQPLDGLAIPGDKFWNFAEKAGYSGTLIITKQDISVKRVEPPDFLSAEGRLVVLELQDFFLLNVYFPNGGMGPIRLEYKMKYYNHFLAYVKDLQKTKPVIFTGDVNTAHEEIDLARPKANSKTTGFLPEERNWLDFVIQSGFADIWRELNPQKIGYTWWDYKTKARERDVGWRIDYFFCSNDLLNHVESCKINSQFMGSDHAPIELTIN